MDWYYNTWIIYLIIVIVIVIIKVAVFFCVRSYLQKRAREQREAQAAAGPITTTTSQHTYNNMGANFSTVYSTPTCAPELAHASYPRQTQEMKPPAYDSVIASEQQQTHEAPPAYSPSAPAPV